jgi:hypothetical protein
VAHGRATAFVLAPGPSAAPDGLAGASVATDPSSPNDGWLAVLYVIFGQVVLAFVAS